MVTSKSNTKLRQSLDMMQFQINRATTNRDSPFDSVKAQWLLSVVRGTVRIANMHEPSNRIYALEVLLKNMEARYGE